MICFDTAPLIWGVQGWAKEHQEEMVERTKRYIQFLSRQKTKIMIPTPTLSEYLIGIPLEQRSNQISQITTNFIVQPFDIPSAIVAAELMSEKTLITDIRDEYNIDKQPLKVDAQILAIAITRRAEKVITNDLDHFLKLAKGMIKVEQVPEISEQNELNLASDIVVLPSD